MSTVRADCPPERRFGPVRPQRRVLEATVAASLLSGAPSLLHALSRGGVGGAWRYGVGAVRSVGTLVPPGRPGIVPGALAHFAISVVVGETFGRALPTRHSRRWGAAAGAGVGIVGVGIIGRRYPGIRELPFGPQLADNVAFGIIFAAVADRPAPLLTQSIH